MFHGHDAARRELGKQIKRNKPQKTLAPKELGGKQATAADDAYRLGRHDHDLAV